MILAVLGKMLKFSSWFKKPKPEEGYSLRTMYEDGELVGYIATGNVPKDWIKEVHKRLVKYETINVDGINYKIKSK